MDQAKLIQELKEEYGVSPLAVTQGHSDETTIEVKPDEFKKTCLCLHKTLRSPVMMLFASDDRAKLGGYTIQAVFIGIEYRKWFFAAIKVPSLNPAFESIARDIYSANLFEREIKEMFGLEPKGNPDTRRLRLHEEVWPEGFYPLRKDFDAAKVAGAKGRYTFNQVEGEGIFEVPVGPVHAGIIGPGHFRFSAAGEPIIDLDIRLGFTHRGAEKLFERKQPAEVIKLSECVAGDSAFAHSLAFCRAVEKISGTVVPERAIVLRAVFLELERLYNHAAGIGGIALDVGFSAPAAYASIVKESVHQLNDRLTGSRFLKSVNAVSGLSKDISEENVNDLRKTLKSLTGDFGELKKLLFDSVSFMDRVETTGRLSKKIAEDFGVMGLAGRASGVGLDFRKNSRPYAAAGFKLMTRKEGDVLARLGVRLDEFEESIRLIEFWLADLPEGSIISDTQVKKEGSGLGCVEGWRGPVLYWLALDNFGAIRRCKIVDPSFHNWPGLSYAVHDNIIPDFPVCNKSFDLSYSGNDL
ncbi:MAG: NADH-quinone oxidoreductase subunit C [Candidatus Margulisbacteria bacterium]|nr:NADH-quinone oxidoreductase subunit C [Candidatus Margulisiibacteriota bacterium]